MRTSCIRSPVSANLHSLIYWFNDKPDIIPGGRLKYDCFCLKTKMKNCVNLYWKLKLWRIQYFCLLKDEGPRWQTLQSNNYLGRCFWRLPAKMWRKLKPPLMQWVSILYYCVHHWQPMIYMQCSLHITIQEDYKYFTSYLGALFSSFFGAWWGGFLSGVVKDFKVNASMNENPGPLAWRAWG